MEGRLPSFIQGTVSTFQLIYLYITVSYPGRCVSPPYGEQLMRGVSTWQRRHMRGERARSASQRRLAIQSRGCGLIWRLPGWAEWQRVQKLSRWQETHCLMLRCAS